MASATTNPEQDQQEQNNHLHKTTTVDQTVSRHVLARHSTRVFLPTPIPQETLEQCLSLAQHAPSNSNIQPWRIHIITGDALHRLGQALTTAVESNVPSTVEPIPDQYRHYRSEMGHQLYGEHGYNIPRGEKEAMTKARMRNYVFFEAPAAAIICMDRSLAAVDVLSVGLHLQTLMLLLQERGVGTCVSVSVAGYPDVIRKELGIPEEMMILSGMAMGYEDANHHVNTLKINRDRWRDNVTFVSE